MHFLKLCCPLRNKLIIIKKKNFHFFFEKKEKKNDGSIEIWNGNCKSEDLSS